MSIDTPDTSTLPATIQPAAANEPIETDQWESLRAKIIARAEKSGGKCLFGKSAKGGAVYRWGLGAAIGDACHDRAQVLSRLACGTRVRKRDIEAIDLAATIDRLIDRINGSSRFSAIDSSECVLWSAALPALVKRLDQGHWWHLLSSLQQLRESILQRSEPYLPAHLMIAGELGLTLAWRLRDLPSCKRMQASSIEAVKDWCRRDDESVSAAISGFTDTRLVLASLLRSLAIIEATSKTRVGKQPIRIGQTLATWVAAMTTHTGQTAMGAASRKDVRDDLGPHGLLQSATRLDPDSLRPAVSAALGAEQSGGRLVWEVNLPECLHHDSEAKIAVMFPAWDVRRGRVHLDYSGEEMTVELFAGRSGAVAGAIQTMIELGDEEQQACGNWDEMCEYSDDDVHFLEFEQPWTGGLTLQRQIMLLRDDRSLMFSDAVVSETGQFDDQRPIRYSTRLPVHSSQAMKPEAETREFFFKDGGRRCLVIPLAASEWRVGATDATLKETADHHLLYSVTGRNRLYAPLWFDFQKRRFKRKRTWRQLTVVDQLRIVNRDEAVAYRIQIGSEHWMIYRSLGDMTCRTALGKHLIADFYCSRFDPGDGSHDEMITVDDNEPSND